MLAISLTSRAHWEDGKYVYEPLGEETIVERD